MVLLLCFACIAEAEQYTAARARVKAFICISELKMKVEYMQDQRALVMKANLAITSYQHYPRYF